MEPKYQEKHPHSEFNPNSLASVCGPTNFNNTLCMNETSRIWPHKVY